MLNSVFELILYFILYSPIVSGALLVLGFLELVFRATNTFFKIGFIHCLFIILISVLNLLTGGFEGMMIFTLGFAVPTFLLLPIFLFGVSVAKKHTSSRYLGER